MASGEGARRESGHSEERPSQAPTFEGGHRKRYNRNPEEEQKSRRPKSQERPRFEKDTLVSMIKYC